MAKQNLLLVDADLRSVRVLEVSLRKAGYNVASAGSAPDALSMLELSRPDLVLCDTRLPTMDGFQLIQEMRSRPELAGIPLMILSSDVSVETKVRGLELGVEDYLTKPIYIKELLARVNIVLQRKRREGIERLEQGHKRKFSGSLSDMGVVDLLQAIDHNKKSGVLYLTSGSFDGAIYFCNGAPVDAAVGRLRGSRAIYRTLLWTDGTFEIDFREIDREDHVQSSMQAVLMEGLRRVDEWGRLLEQLPNLETVFDVSDTQLMARLADIPDQINSVLREFDGRRSLWEIVDACEADDLDTLNAVSKLYFEGLLYNTGRRSGEVDPIEDEPPPMSELSEMALPHISSGPPVITHTLAPAWPSVPSGDGSESELIDDTLQLNIPATPKLPGGLRIKPSDVPKRRKGRKRKKRSGQSLPAAAEVSPKQPMAAKGKAKAGEPEVREVDESVAEITPSTIAPPPEEAENAAIIQAEADASAATVPVTSMPPQLPRSQPISIPGSTSTPPELARASQAAIHDSPTLDLMPVRNAATPPPLQVSWRPPLTAATDTAALKSTTPPPLSDEAETARLATEPPRETRDLHSDEETTETQVSLRGSIPPPSVESHAPRKASSPPPLPYMSKPPGPGFGSHRGVTSPGFAAAPMDEETLAAAAAAISEAETSPPPFAAGGRLAQASEGPAARAGVDASVPSAGEISAPGADASSIEHGVRSPPAAAAGTTWEGDAQQPRGADFEPEHDTSSSWPASSITETNPAPYPASIPARELEAAVLAASGAPPALRADASAEAEQAVPGLSDPPPFAGEPALAEDARPGPRASASVAPDGSSTAPRDLSAPPMAADSVSPQQLDRSMVAASSSEATGAASGPPRDLAVPPSAANSPLPEMLGLATDDNSAAAGAFQALPSPAGSSVPDGIERAAAAPGSEETGDSAAAPSGAVPGGASDLPRDLARQENAADASLPEGIEPAAASSAAPGGASDLSRDLARQESAADASLPEGIEPAAASSTAAGGASDLPRDLGSSPAAVDSVVPERLGHAEVPASSGEEAGGLAREEALSAQPMAAGPSLPEELDRSAGDASAGEAGSSPGRLSVSEAAPSSVAPETLGRAVDDASAGADPRDVSSPPLAADTSASEGAASGESLGGTALPIAAEPEATESASTSGALPSPASIAPSVEAALSAAREGLSGPPSAATSGLPAANVGAVAREPASGQLPDGVQEQEIEAGSTGAKTSSEVPPLAEPEREFTVPALAVASAPPGAMVDAPSIPAEAEQFQHAALPALASSAPANDVIAKAEEDFSDLDAAAASLERASPPPLPAAGSRYPAPRARTSPPPLPYTRARDDAELRQLGSPPPLATATEPPPAAAAMSSPLPLPVDTHTDPGGYVAITPSSESPAEDTSKRMRAPLQRTAVPPPFAPDGSPRSTADTATHEAQNDGELARAVELVTNSVPPRISTVTSSVRPHGTSEPEPAGDDTRTAASQDAATSHLGGAAESGENEPPASEFPANENGERNLLGQARSASAADDRNPAGTLQRDSGQTAASGDGPKRDDVATSEEGRTKPRGTEPSNAEETGSARRSAANDPDGASSAAESNRSRPPSGSQHPQKQSNVISFVPRKREDVADTGKDSGAGQSARRGTSTSPSNTSAAPGQAAAQPKRRVSRWVQAGGAAATVALAAGLFALRARDTAPQGSLISAVPEVVDQPAAATERMQGELEALHKQAQAIPEAQPQNARDPAAAAAPSAPQPTAATPQSAPEKVETAAPSEQETPATERAAAPLNSESAQQKGAAAAETKAPAEQPTSPASDATQPSAAQVLAKGRGLEQRGKKQDAINLYAKAAEEGNASSELLSRMAFLYLNQGKNALAETAAKRATDADETNSEAWIVLGAAQDGLGKKQAAEEAYRNCAQKGQGQYVTECKRMLR